MINLETMTSCVVDVKLDVPRRVHTGEGDIVCGGRDNDNNELSTCYNINNGTTINLINKRSEHISWTTVDGIYLIGGYSTSRTTELITGETTQAGFPLQYSTR